MPLSDALTALQQKFKEDILSFFEKSPKRLYVDISPGALVPVVQHLFKERGMRFNIASGVDAREHMEILYHFTSDEENFIVSLRVVLDKKKPEIDSLAPMFEGANWIEREIHEMLGVTFKGHPDMRRLLLSDDWPDGVYPLRCDYKEWDKKAVRDRGV